MTCHDCQENRNVGTGPTGEPPVRTSPQSLVVDVLRVLEGYLLAKLLVLLLQLPTFETVLLECQRRVPQTLDGALEALVLLLQLQDAAGGALVQLKHEGFPGG